MVPVQTVSETVSGNMGMPRPGTKRSGVFGKIPDRDWDRGVWSGSDRVPISLGPNFPNTNLVYLHHHQPYTVASSCLATPGNRYSLCYGTWLALCGSSSSSSLYTFQRLPLNDACYLFLFNIRDEAPQWLVFRAPSIFWLHTTVWAVPQKVSGRTWNPTFNVEISEYLTFTSLYLLES